MAPQAAVTAAGAARCATAVAAAALAVAAAAVAAAASTIATAAVAAAVVAGYEANSLRNESQLGPQLVCRQLQHCLHGRGQDVQPRPSSLG